MAISGHRYWGALYFTSFLFGTVLFGTRHGQNGSTQICQLDEAEPKVAEDAKQRRTDVILV